MKRQAVLAIDVGATKVAWAIGQPGLDRGVAIPGQPPRPPFDLLGCGIAPLAASKGSWPGDPIGLAETLERALSEAGISRVPEYGVAALSHPALQHRQAAAHVDLADEPVTIRGRDLERVQALAVTHTLAIDREVLVVEPLGYSGNGFSGVADPRGLTATRLSGTFHLVTVPVAVRRVMRQALELLGVELERMTSSLKASIASGIVDEWKEERVLVVDLGGLSCDVALLDHGSLINSQTVPWGGELVVQAVARECRLPWDRALAVTLQGFHAKPEVSALLENQLGALRGYLEAFLRDELPPARAVVTGRASLIDGLIERLETALGVPASLGRSPWARAPGELPRQVALSPVLGMLALGLERSESQVAVGVSSRLIDRLLTRTKQILVEYF